MILAFGQLCQDSLNIIKQEPLSIKRLFGFLLDVDEYLEFSKRWHYGPEIDHILKKNVRIIVDWINNEKGPFSKEFVAIWYERYLELSRQKK